MKKILRNVVMCLNDISYKIQHTETQQLDFDYIIMHVEIHLCKTLRMLKKRNIFVIKIKVIV